MVSSGGGGSGRAPSQPTPSGAIADYGQSTSFNPGFTNVLGAGWATPDSVDAGLAAGPQYRTPPPPPPAADGGFGVSGGYGRQLLAAMMDKTPAIGADKAMMMQRLMMMPGAQASGNWFAPAPLPKPGAGASPADQLLYQIANQSRAPAPSGGGQRPMGNAVGAYGGGGGSRSPSRGGYSSSR